MPQELPFPRPGVLVHVRGDCWQVVDVARFEDCGLCRLAGVRPTNRGVERTLILPFDRPVVAGRSPFPTRSSRRRFVRSLRARVVRTTASGGLRAGLAGHFDLLPFQLEAALAILRGETRILIADEVGLGKTVQAALILAELFARDPAARCLVLAPAGLCGQWVAELQDRFRLPARHVDAASLRSLSCLSTPDVTPWEQLPLAVASFDYAKQPEVLSGLRDLRWDALVVDEAHMVALAAGRAALVRVLSARARRVVLLTATPHAADTEGFRALCDTGRLPGDPPILLFRRTREALGVGCPRRVVVMAVVLSPAERRMHDALERYTAAVWRESSAGGAGQDARLAMVVLRKRAASGPAALQASVSRRLRWLAPQTGPSDCQLLLPLDGPDELDAADEEPGAVLRAPGLRDADAERRRLSDLLDLARAASATDSKVRVLERLLARAREPAIVFTEYRDTLLHLADRLRSHTTMALLHGGVEQAARREAIRAFTAGEVRVLLATDAAAHGLNLHARCRMVIDVELPWTPARLEQRIGRVDRIGQRRRVHAVHLVARRTSEEKVLAGLVLRLGREKSTLGEAGNPLGAAGEMDVAALVFAGGRGQAGLPPGPTGRAAGPTSGVPHGGGEEFFRRLSLRSSAEDEQGRLEWVRRLAAPPGRHSCLDGQDGSLPPCWTIVRRRRGAAALPAGLLCLFVARIVDHRGSLVEDAPIVLHVEVGHPLRQRRALEAALPMVLRACRSELDRHAGRIAAARLENLRSFAASRLAPLAAREAALEDASRQSGSPLQPGLFDRRALKRADEDRRHRDREAEEAASHIASLSRSARLELSAEPELVLVLGVCY